MKKLLALCFLVCSAAGAQQQNFNSIPDCSSGICAGNGVPTFACFSGQKYARVDTPGTNYTCTGNPPQWIQDAGAGGSMQWPAASGIALYNGFQGWSSSLSLAANQILGAISATPQALPIPSCAGGANALNWSSGTGFQCNTIAVTGGVTSINALTGPITFAGSGVSCTGSTCTFTSSGGSMVYPSLSGIPTVNNGTTWAPAIFYVDSNSPASCTVSSVAYTTAFDCAFATAKAWTQSGNSTQSNATLLVGSTGLLTTNVGIQEPTATNNHGSVNIVGNGVNASSLQLTSSLATGVCMVTQPPEATSLNYATVAISGLSLDANSNADCIMSINGTRNGKIANIVGKNVRAGSGNIGFQFGASNASTATVFETNIDDVKLEGTGGGYTPAIIACTITSGNPVCTISDHGSYPTGTFAVQVHGVGNGGGPCSVYPTWTATGTTTLLTLTASGGTCVGPLYVSVTPAAKVDYNFLFGPGLTDSTAKDIRAVESSAFAGMKTVGHPNTFIHPHCYVGQFACVEDDGGNTFVGLESDSIGGFAAAVEGTGTTYTGTTQIYNNFQRYAGSSLFYVDQGTSAGSSIGVTVAGVSCNGNRQNQGGYHNLVIGTGLPYANASTGGGAQDLGYPVPAGVQMDNILNCSTSPTVSTVTSHIGSFITTGPVTLPADPTLALQAATKQYVDANGGGTPYPSPTTNAIPAASITGGVTSFINSAFSDNGTNAAVSEPFNLVGEYQQAVGTATSSVNDVSNVTNWLISYWNGTTAVSASWNVYAWVAQGASPPATVLTYYSPANLPTSAVLYAIDPGLAATSSLNYNSPRFKTRGACWNGSVSTLDDWNWQGVPGTGTNPTETLQFTHSGCAGTAAVEMPGLKLDGTPEIASGVSTNSDVSGEFGFSAQTTQTYTLANTYASHPECWEEPQFSTTVAHWITYTGVTSITINFASAVTGNVSYGCIGRN